MDGEIFRKANIVKLCLKCEKLFHFDADIVERESMLSVNMGGGNYMFTKYWGHLHLCPLKTYRTFVWRCWNEIRNKNTSCKICHVT